MGEWKQQQKKKKKSSLGRGGRWPCCSHVPGAAPRAPIASIRTASPPASLAGRSRLARSRSSPCRWEAGVQEGTGVGWGLTIAVAPSRAGAVGSPVCLHPFSSSQERYEAPLTLVGIMA